MVGQLDFELAGTRRALLPASLAELDRLVADARREGHALGVEDELRIAGALSLRDVREAHRDQPEIPEELRGYDVSAASHGRRYEIGLDVHPASREAVHAARRRYIGELRLVQSYVQKGLSLEAAWTKVRKRLRLDPVRKLPRRLRRRKVDAPTTVTPHEKPAEAQAATSAQPEAPKPAPAAPRWPRDGLSPGKPAAPEDGPLIPSVIVNGIDGARLKWI